MRAAITIITNLETLRRALATQRWRRTNAAKKGRKKSE